MVSHRQQRLSELLHEELGLLITSELADPRLAENMAVVSHVRVSADLRNAHVYVEHAAGPEAAPAVLSALRHSEAYLRRQLLENLSLRFIPELTFHVDTVGQRAKRVDELLDALARESASRDATDGPEPSGTAFNTD